MLTPVEVMLLDAIVGAPGMVVILIALLLADVPTLFVIVPVILLYDVFDFKFVNTAVRDEIVIVTPG
jgi:hypothetical protein